MRFDRFIKNIWRDRRGQELIEYALMAAMVAAGMGVFVPRDLAPAFSTIFSRVTAVVDRASGN